MTRWTFTITVALFFSAGAATSQTVTFESPCDCQGNHGEHRWSSRSHNAVIRVYDGAGNVAETHEEGHSR
jgi:hypothetical protein